MGFWSALIGTLFVIILIALLITKLKIGPGVYCKLAQRLDGKTVVITGATSGIGRSAAEELARRGATIVIACRNRAKAEGIVSHIRKTTGNELVSFLLLNLESLASVQNFVKTFLLQYPKVDILINNAGYLGPKQKSKDGIDMTFQVNYLSQFYLTVLLCEEMKKKPLKHPFRVINLASSGYLQHPLNFNDLTNDRGDFEIYSAYGRSKLAMMLFTFKLHYQHAASTPRLVQAVSVNPGATKSELLRNWPGIFGVMLRFIASLLFRTVEAGAQTVIYAAVIDGGDELSGKLLYDCQVIPIDPMARDYRTAEKLWTDSMEMCSSILKK